MDIKLDKEQANEYGFGFEDAFDVISYVGQMLYKLQKQSDNMTEEQRRIIKDLREAVECLEF